MPNVLMPIRNLVTRRAANAYAWHTNGSIKTLGSGSAFHITRILRVNGGVWVRSGLGHWYQYLELDHLRDHYNTVRLHETIGYVTPDDEHHGRGHTIRKAREEGLKRARQHRIAQRRQTRHNQPQGHQHQ